MKKIVVVCANNVMEYPPVINLVLNLLNNSHSVTLIGQNAVSISDEIKNSENFRYYNLPIREKESTLVERILFRIKRKNSLIKITKESMRDADILWTTTSETIGDLGNVVLDYRNVMQLMELIHEGYIFKNIIKFPLGKIAAASWKIVVPEENRAYIQKVWWNLRRTPYVLPNKPYSLEYGDITDDMTTAIEMLKNEPRKILLYLGGIWPDRDLTTFSDAVDKLGDDYCLCIIGKPYGKEAEETLSALVKKDSVIYLGSYKAPKHLAFVKYAHIGLLPYRPTFDVRLSELNALYCAPNKIYEYAGFDIPMLGSDVLGLKNQFEKFNIGVCCDIQNVFDIISGINRIEQEYDVMKNNCKSFYDSIDLDDIVNKIINEE